MNLLTAAPICRTWSVSGVDTSKQADGTVCVHTFTNGSQSTRTLKNDGKDDSFLGSIVDKSSGKVATLDVSFGDASFAYKESVGCSDGSSKTHTRHGYLGFGLKKKISVGADWTLAAGTYTDPGAVNSKYTWAAATPSVKLDLGALRVIQGYNFAE